MINHNKNKHKKTSYDYLIYYLTLFPRGVDFVPRQGGDYDPPPPLEIKEGSF